MTRIYFVRHAQPDFSWNDDLTRPLTSEGIVDSRQVTKTLANVHLDYVISSPYFRSMKTIEECAKKHDLVINTDIRFRERESGYESNNMNMFRKRWSDFDYHEENGESLRSVQERNIAALNEVLEINRNKSILIGTHGTALSTILNYYNNSFGCDDFLRIIDYMPYIIRLDFDYKICVGQEELLIIEKKFKK